MPSPVLAHKEQLALKLERAASGKTILSHRYMAYPLSVSPVFRLEEELKEELKEELEEGLKEGRAKASTKRAYLYRMNTSPGLLANDALKISLQLASGSQLYLADQSATKVHTMPDGSAQSTAQATVDYQIDLEERTTLEFLPEPLILFTGAALKQQTNVTIHSTAALSLGEIVLPGRLARGESYQFRQYFSRLRVSDSQGRLWFAESMKLLGKENRFVQAPLFASGPVLGTLVLILPETVATPQTLKTLSAQIDALETDTLNLASSVLPQGRGLFVRAMAQTTREMQSGFKAAVNYVRTLRGEALLPYSL